MISKFCRSTRLPTVTQEMVLLGGRNFLTFGIIGLDGAWTGRLRRRRDTD